MPYKPLTPCAQPGCPERVRPGLGFCTPHKAQRQQEYNQRRPARHNFYATYEWVRFRTRILDERGRVCVRCGSNALVVLDHVVTIEQRPDLRLEPSNVQVLCSACHNRKTAGR